MKKIVPTGKFLQNGKQSDLGQFLTRKICHNVDTSVQCGPSTLSPLTNTEIAINLLCDKDIDDYEDECYDFQDELFNFEQILRMSRDTM